MENSIYVVLPKTYGFLSKIMKIVSKYEYSHITICLNDKLEEFYSFSRFKANTPLISGFTKEYRSHLVGKKGIDLECKIYKIDVTNKEYNKIVKYINKLKNDKEIMFNYMTLLTYPILKGMSVYKSENCCSFVCKVIEMVEGINLDKPYHKYVPKDIEKILKKYPNELKVLDASLMYEDEHYFIKEKFINKFFISIRLIYECFYRTIFKKRTKSFKGISNF